MAGCVCGGGGPPALHTHSVHTYKYTHKNNTHKWLPYLLTSGPTRSMRQVTKSPWPSAMNFLRACLVWVDAVGFCGGLVWLVELYCVCGIWFRSLASLRFGPCVSSLGSPCIHTTARTPETLQQNHHPSTHPQVRHELMLPQNQGAEAGVDHLRDAVHHALERLGVPVGERLGGHAGLERGGDPDWLFCFVMLCFGVGGCGVGG